MPVRVSTRMTSPSLMNNGTRTTAPVSSLAGFWPPVAARFEVFARGIELANGFHELADAAEQRRRFEADIDSRRRAGRHVPPLDETFLDALTRGLPDCAGVAVGLDRLVALALGADGVAAAMAFVHRPPSR